MAPWQTYLHPIDQKGMAMLSELSQIFLTFLQKNMTVAVVIIAVLLARLLLRRMPKKYSYVLWSLVGIRMIFDLPIASRLSVFNLFRSFAGRASTAETMLSPKGVTNPVGTTAAFGAMGTTGTAASNAISGNAAASVTAHSLSTTQMILGILGWIWLIGVGLFVAYGIYSYIKCRILVQTAIFANDIDLPASSRSHVSGRKAHLFAGSNTTSVMRNGGITIWECDRIPSPFVLGILRPRIYIPFRMGEQEQAYILAHEQYHVRRFDPLWKLIAFLLLAVYWWNPLVWIAFFYMVRDMEMSCDEAVVRELGEDIRADYSASLLSLATGRRIVHPYTIAPVAFGEGDAGRRIKNVLNFKKPQTWVAIIVIVLLVIVGISCLTNGKDGNHDTQNTQTNNTEQTSSETVSDTQDGRLQGTEIPESQAQDSSELNSAAEGTTEISDKVPVKSLMKWALAFCNRDVVSIKDLAGESALEDLKDQNLLDDNDNLGWSSPWPMAEFDDGKAGYQIANVDADKNTATILYYAWTSDPHITAWAETLHYEVTDGKLEVISEELKMLDAISGGADFEAAYPNDITDTMMDYQTNGLGRTLNDHAMSANGMSPDGSYNLTDPVEAARYLLNLLPNDRKVEITADKKGDLVDLTVHFTEDDVTHTITMERPWSTDGIWVVRQIDPPIAINIAE